MSSHTRPSPVQKLRGHRTYGRVARASVRWAYARSVVNFLVTIPTAMVLARLLTPEEFGIAAAATFFGHLAGRLSSGGMGSGLTRLKELRDDHITTVFTMNAGATAVVIVALLVSAPFIGAFYRDPRVGWLIPLVAVNFALGALCVVQQALLHRDLRYREIATIGSIDMTAAALGAVTFAALGFSYWSLVLGEICGAFVKFVYGVKVAGWHLKIRFVPAAARELGSFVAGSYAKRLLEDLTRNVDNLIVGRVLGLTALGFYDKGFSVVNKLYLRMMVGGPSVSFRIFSIIQDEPERFRRAYHKVIMTATLLSYPAFAALGTMAPHLVVVAFGERWRPAVVPLQILCISFSLKILSQYAFVASQARGWIWPHVWRQAVQVLCIVGGVYLAMPWGINGAALAVVGAAIVMFFLTQGMMRRATGLGWSDVLRPQIPAVSSATALIVIIWGIDGLLAERLATLLILAAQAAAAGLFMLAFAWWCPFSEARLLLHDAVSDMSPHLAAWVWSDIAAQQKAQKDRHHGRPAAAPGDIDAETNLAS